ncbi:MAG: ABC transporter permease, partial [Bacillota bacterium]
MVASRNHAKAVRRILKTRLMLLTTMAGVLVLSAFVLPAFHLGDPYAQSVAERLKPPGANMENGAIAWLGTDQLGRDILSRLAYGSRVSLAVGSLTVLLSGLLGTVVGMVAGYYGRWTDMIVMRVADLQLAFPSILLAITLASVLGPSFRNIVLTLTLTTWVVYAR